MEMPKLYNDLSRSQPIFKRRNYVKEQETSGPTECQSCTKGLDFEDV